MSQPLVLPAATLEELTAKLKELGAIHSLKATVDMRLSVVSDDGEEVKEYTNVRGFILTFRPTFIRVQAQVPVVRSTAFDMASDGNRFQVHLPSKNRFFEGENKLDKTSPKRIENVRPQHILEALLIDPPRQGEDPVLENIVEGNRGYQIVQLIQREEDETLKLSRKVWFDRAHLEVARQQVFDDQAEVVTDAHYQNWSQWDSSPFPQVIFISRPKEGYELQVRILKLGLNETIPDDRFVLEPPPGVRVERIGESSEKASAGEFPP